LYPWLRETAVLEDAGRFHRQGVQVLPALNKKATGLKVGAGGSRPCGEGRPNTMDLPVAKISRIKRFLREATLRATGASI